MIGGHGIFFGLLILWLGTLIGAVESNSLLAWSSGLLYICYDTWLIAYIAWKTRHITAELCSTSHANSPLSIGVIITARNEVDVIVTTIENLLAQTDPPEQILVVNDGSSDQTAHLLQSKFGLAADEGIQISTQYPLLSVLHKAHSGKADSLNKACALLQTDVIITVDADTWLATDAVAAMRSAFEHEPQLVAACGVLTPRCSRSWHGRIFAWFQTYEYIRAFLSRAAWMQANALLLVSGAFAAYRRDVLLSIGGYDCNSLVEDYELIHRLHRYAANHGLDWRVRVLPNAVAETDAPATVRTFLHQRRRWFAGFLKTQFQYRAMHGNARYGAVGKLMLPIKEADALQPIYGITAFILLCIFVFSASPFNALIFWVIGAKLLIDFTYHMWAIRLYHRWLGVPIMPRTWFLATLSTLAEPFCFQILRHLSAVWGWITVATGQHEWIAQRIIGETK